MQIDNTNNHFSPVCCAHPNIVLNRNFYRLFFTQKLHLMNENGEFFMDSQHYTDLTDDELAKVFYHLFNGVPTLDQLEGLYFVDSSGRRTPLYFAFPCGKCELCRSRKSSEYAFRSACETVTHPDNPLFVTLTYNNASLPKDGVQLDDLQRYFKRLRFSLRKEGFRSDFRYLAVSEYGSKFGRPHYHFILWNYPLKDITDRYPTKSVNYLFHHIRSAWRTYVLVDGHRKYVRCSKCNKYLPVMRAIGFVKILPVKTGCTGYITKYFRKDDHNVAGYKNKTFLVSSRKGGGIGSAHIRSFYKFALEHPNLPYLQVLDPNNQHTFKYPVSGYVKNILFPSPSVLMRKNGLYSKCKQALENIKKLRVAIGLRDKFTGGFHLSDWRSFTVVRKLLKKLDFIGFVPPF